MAAALTCGAKYVVNPSLTVTCALDPGHYVTAAAAAADATGATVPSPHKAPIPMAQQANVATPDGSITWG